MLLGKRVFPAMLQHTPGREWWQDRYNLVLYVINYGEDEIVLIIRLQLV